MGYQDFETVSLVMLSFTKLVRFLQNETAVWNILPAPYIKLNSPKNCHCQIFTYARELFVI